jgi:hypothetical protein
MLLSYHYFRDIDLEKLLRENFTEPYPELFADSGAFSAMTQGAVITVDEYAEWLKRWSHLFSTYANLDVIRNPEVTWANQQRLEDQGFAPLPVFHVATPWEWLEHYLERYQYIALGVAGSRSSKYMGWVVRCFQMARQEGAPPRAVYHGFGITAWTPLRNFPWYSADSSSWMAGFRYGSMKVFNSMAGEWVSMHASDRKAWKKHAGLVRDLGFNPTDFYDGNPTRATRSAIALRSYLEAERWLQEFHGPVEIPGGGVETGLKLYLADFPRVTEGTSDIVRAYQADPGFKYYATAPTRRGPDNGGGLGELKEAWDELSGEA